MKEYLKPEFTLIVFDENCDIVTLSMNTENDNDFDDVEEWQDNKAKGEEL